MPCMAHTKAHLPCRNVIGVNYEHSCALEPRLPIDGWLDISFCSTYMYI